MKALFTILAALLCVNLASAQTVDTILFENFQIDKFVDWPPYPSGDDTTWVSFDEDGITTYDNDENHRAWYFSQFFYNAEDSITGEINYCAATLSYLQGSAPGNRNWLITPPLHIEDANYTAHWKSASFQLPRYLDGYLLLAAEGSNDLFSGVFLDTLFQAASMEAIIGNSNSVHLADFSFTPGYIHADSLRNDDYVDLWAPDDSTLMHGLLEPHSVSLAAYAGKTIYLAFLHNSDDDYFLAVDDILVTRSAVSGSSSPDASAFRLVIYPNPVENWLNVLYRLPEAADVAITLRDMSGKTVIDQKSVRQTAGEQQMNLNLGNLPSGNYSLTLRIGETVLTRNIVRK